MNKKKKTSTPKFEIFIILIFFFSFIIWATSKCNIKKEELNEDANQEEIVVADSTAALIETTKPPEQKPPSQQYPSPVSEANSKYSKLWVVIDRLNLRTGPSLDSTIILRIPLFEQVYFLNERTDFKTRVNLGLEEANEPWVKVKTKRGQAGWVYGAGVDYYKKKRKGVGE